MGIITDILKEIPLSAVLREKIVGLETKMSVLESENLVLTKDNEKLKFENRQQGEKIQTLENLISTYHNNPLQKFTFVDPPGYYTHPEYPYPICPICLIKKNLKSPVSNGRCTVCKEPISETLVSGGEVFTVPYRDV